MRPSRRLPIRQKLNLENHTNPGLAIMANFQLRLLVCCNSYSNSIEKVKQLCYTPFERKGHNQTATIRLVIVAESVAL